MTTFELAREELGELVSRFGPHRRGPTGAMHYPFWRMQYDGVWELDRPHLVTVTSSNNAHVRDLLRHGITGGLLEHDYNALQGDPQLAWKVALNLLDAHFPETLHSYILESVGITDQATVSDDSDYEIVETVVRRRRRDPAFRESVLMAYDWCCAVCAMSLSIAGSKVALEAAHIRWHASGGSNEVRNGLALCVLHHSLFDLGAFTLLPDLSVFVSGLLEGNEADNALGRHHQTPLLVLPDTRAARPSLRYLRWHQREVFRSPEEIARVRR